MKQSYKAWVIGKPELKYSIDAEAAWEASESFAGEYVDKDGNDCEEYLRVKVLTPLGQELAFEVQRVTYWTTCQDSDEIEEFGDQAAMKKKKFPWYSVDCPHCGAKKARSVACQAGSSTEPLTKLES